MCFDLNRNSFGQLVTDTAHQHTGALMSVALREGLGFEDALDAVQDSFLSFVQMREAHSLLEDPSEVRALLSVLVRNASRNLRRRHRLARPHEELEDAALEGPTTEELLGRAEDRLRLVGCMRQLESVQRSVVTLRVLEELSGAEAGRLLGLKPGHVAVLLHRAKQDLAQCMAVGSAGR
jgi:RNA polymerase sigma-70 factor (ECF subfamily)